MYRGIEKQNNTIRFAVLLLCLLSLILTMPHAAYAATSSKVTLPLEQEFITNRPDLSVTVEYVLTAAESGNPMPEGSSGNSYTVKLSADQKKADIVIVFTKPGTYQYELTEKTPSDFPFTWKTETYRITVIVGQDFTTIVTIRNSDGKKVSEMGWSYTDVYEPTPTPSPAATATPGEDGNIDDASKVPQTGDQSAMKLWVFLGVLSSLGLLCCIYLLFRMRRQEVKADE